MSARLIVSRTPRMLASFIFCCLLLSAISRAYSQDAPATAPPFKPPVLQPSLGDWLTGLPLSQATKELFTDPLQVEPFAGAPLDDPKGLAAKIKAKQLDAKNRVKAIKFLGTVDCVTDPEAQDMLIKTMKDDPSEPVRYEAVKALEVMLSRGPSKETGIKRICEYVTDDLKFHLKAILHPDPCLLLKPHQLLEAKQKHFFRRTSVR